MLRNRLFVRWFGLAAVLAAALTADGHRGEAVPVSAASVEAGASASVGQWGPLIEWPLVAVHTVLLRTGEVLVFDAWESPTIARVWNPATGRFREAPASGGLFCSAHVTLADGRVLVVGGHDPTLRVAGAREVFLFDPGDDSWTQLEDLHDLRWYPSATRLGDGRVVALSGNTSWEAWADTPEVYDPATGRWTQLGGVHTSDLHEEEYPLSFLQPDGRVFTLISSTAQSRVLDVDARTWRDAGLGTTPAPNASAVIYRPGKLLVAGGGEIHEGQRALTTAATVDLNARQPRWERTGAMAKGRYMANLVALPDGTVLAAGGSGEVDQLTHDAILEAEIWDPDSGRWSSAGEMAVPRMYHSTATLLPDGRVLVAGGGRLGGLDPYSSAQLYSPPYLFRGPRPVIQSAPSEVALGSNFAVSVAKPNGVASVVLIETGSTTHSLNMGGRFVPLDFTVSGGRVNVELTSNANVAPPGFYMLFVVDGDGVPSVAAMLKVTAPGGSGGAQPFPRPAEPAPLRPNRIAVGGIAVDGGGAGVFAGEARLSDERRAFEDAETSSSGLFLCAVMPPVVSLGREGPVPRRTRAQP